MILLAYTPVYIGAKSKHHFIFSAWSTRTTGRTDRTCNAPLHFGASCQHIALTYSSNGHHKWILYRLSALNAGTIQSLPTYISCRNLSISKIIILPLIHFILRNLKWYISRLHFGHSFGLYYIIYAYKFIIIVSVQQYGVPTTNDNKK
jgi:hypothetical protein